MRNAPTKACTGPCGRVLPIETFTLRPNGRGGQKRRSRCPECEAGDSRDAYGNRRAARREATRRWEAKNPTYRLRKAAERLGLDPDMVVKHFEDHDGLCDICRRPPVSRKRLTIDHCHKRMIFRGLLCGDCNTAIGLLGDDPDRMRAAAAYVETR